MENKTLRIVSWNCCHQKKGFTDKKKDEILKLNPNILIIQECKRDDWLNLNYSDKNGDWRGDEYKSNVNSKNKINGIGIFCNKDYSIDYSLFIDQDLSKMRYALPYIVKYHNKEILTIFSIWAKEGYKNYHVPILNSLAYYHKKTNSPKVIIGDFNTGSQQNNKNNEKYYKFIEEKLYSEYKLKNCAGSQKWVNTFFRGANSWLDDHCFASNNIQVISFGIGNFDYWKKYSDHCPIIVDINF